MGQSNYRMILDCHPDYFKVDRYVVQGCGTDAQRRAVLSSALRLAQSFSAHVIAEGVEEVCDFQAASNVGVDYVQGYLLARPLTVEALLESGVLTNGLTQRVPVEESILETVANQSALRKVANASSSISVF
jgi:EAL domain-containing protein (putative c-di-GMP-specific phosphodiesterase class I)